MSAASSIIGDDSGFEVLSPSRRKEKMETMLSDFGERMKTHSKRVLETVIDKICELDTDCKEKIRLSLLATHLGKEGPGILNTVLWDAEHSELKDLGLARVQNYVDTVDWDSQTGVPGWSHVCDGEYAPHRSVEENTQAIEEFLEDLRDGVREHASRKHLSEDEISNLELPAVFCEMYRETDGLLPTYWDRLDFLPAFGSSAPWGAGQAEPLDDLIASAREYQYDVAAGWCPGSHMAYDQSIEICYLLCRLNDDELWQWKIFVQASDQNNNHELESLSDFLVWFSTVYDRIHWNSLFGYLERGYRQVVEDMELWCSDSEEDSDDDDEDDDGDEIKDDAVDKIKDEDNG